jgi:hypothetical protein
MAQRSGAWHLTKWWIKYLHGLHHGNPHAWPSGVRPQQSRMCSIKYLIDLHTSPCARDKWWPGHVRACAISTCTQVQKHNTTKQKKTGGEQQQHEKANKEGGRRGGGEKSKAEND